MNIAYGSANPATNWPNNSFQRTLTPAGFGPLNSNRYDTQGLPQLSLARTSGASG